MHELKFRFKLGAPSAALKLCTRSALSLSVLADCPRYAIKNQPLSPAIPLRIQIFLERILSRVHCQGRRVVLIDLHHRAAPPSYTLGRIYIYVELRVLRSIEALDG